MTVRTHALQWVRSGKFQLFDYGSSEANENKYDEPWPIDIAANYGLLEMPIDLVAGTADGEAWLCPFPAVVHGPHKNCLECLILPEAGCYAAVHLQLNIVQQQRVQAPPHHYYLLCTFRHNALTAGIIAKENVQTHFRHMKEAGCNVTLKEFDFGHLDFTFAVKDELRNYVANRLLRSKKL